jgi:hypothetical protein
VFNFLTTGKTKKGHLIVAEGIIVGDLMWQNTLGNELNEVAVRQ